MVGIIIATHGEFAAGIKQSGFNDFWGTGKTLNQLFSCQVKDQMICTEKLREAMEKINSEEILFLVDLWGGSPFNQANRIFEEAPEKRAIVAGLNLPMLIEAYSERLTATSAHEIAKAILPSAKEEVKVRPEELQPEEKQPKAAEAKAPQGIIPEGTVIGDGKLKIVLARIDTRLLHGQVATSWTKATNPDRIIVVSDTVSRMNYVKSL